MDSAPLTDLSPRQRKGLRVARRAAARVVRRRARLFKIARRGYVKLRRHPDALSDVQSDLFALLRLARAWAKKEYRGVPWRTLLYVASALIYFVNPADVIPDALVGIGFVDDIAVVSAIVRAVQRDLDRFLSWEEQAD